MAVRPIDGNELLNLVRLLDTAVVRQNKQASWLLEQVLHDIQSMPTLDTSNQWISVKDGLPEKNGQYYVYYFNKIIDFARYWHGAWFWFDDSSITDWVTHWMPTPTPPED